jgi:NAD(P)-dependent dehydrogenase (short-subunit alcohol dehydrogenase family)
MSLAGKTIFITGAARGIGAETARRAAARGANVAIVGLEPEELERVASACGDKGAAFECDVTDREQTKRAVEGTVERFGGIDAVVANAGIGNGGLMRYMDPDAFESVIRVNLLGAYETLHATLPHVIERRGYVLQICSVAAIAHTPGMAAYSASKAGAEAMANSLRNEVKHHGVAVGTAYFSWIGTEMVFGAEENPIGERMRSTLRGPLAKTYPASEAADAILQGWEERRRVVVTPKWVRPLLAAKTLVQRISETRSGELIPEIEQMTRDEIAKRGDEVWVPSGAGGRAFAAADRSRERAAS